MSPVRMFGNDQSGEVKYCNHPQVEAGIQRVNTIKSQELFTRYTAAAEVEIHVCHVECVKTSKVFASIYLDKNLFQRTISKDKHIYLA